MRSTPCHQPRTFTPRMLVIAGLIALAAGLRVAAHFHPGFMPWNFTPVAAIALFGGACFRNRVLAFVVPLGAMLVSDMAIGFSAMSPLVYACFAVMVLVGMGTLRDRGGAMRIGLVAAGSATGFYLVTNFAVWLASGMYPLTGAGLAASYVAGLPFYQYGTLPGTLVWSAVLFGSFALLQHHVPALRGMSQSDPLAA